MTLQVPYIANGIIERNAEALLAQYALTKGIEIRAPVLIEDIVVLNGTPGSTLSGNQQLLVSP